MHRIVPPALAVASVAAVVAAGALAGPAIREAALTEVTFTAAERRDTLAYWTPDRMREVGANAPLGHDSAAVRPWGGPEMRTVGRLFFTDEKGVDSYCTATSVRGRNRSTVMTAGHCVQLPASPGNHHTNMVFVPGYGEKSGEKNGDRSRAESGEKSRAESGENRLPYGVFVIRAVVMPRSWEQDATTDVAAVVVDPRSGKALADTVGGQQLAVGRKPGGKVTVFGYPDSREERGERLMHCSGTTSATPDGKQSVPCPMEGGSSGGPWLAGFDAKSGRGALVSVNSFGDAEEGSSVMEGEVLGPLAGQVHARAERL
ncbi:trypsin-like serine peptidase [Streptomyces luteolus]|uniref:Trypsin-like peptidase domain-containing protein n=1 Tax=Streptomyces luteolus TaxID=3043615 RepID=A0ABT6SS65_9ACTN|nr:trypsin-like peptidase domain-containing protein [Streptomyces sp. B-S-A12]MDI3417477.1 trypsin-like peptidase domain-containing protein [Streptomyces sp. B-S-A12]